MSGGAEFARFARDLTRASLGIESMAEAAEMRVARFALETARDLVPVDTGETRNKMRVVRRRSGGVAVESSTVASVFQEFGTSLMAPNPFIRPSVDRWEPRLAAEVEGIRDHVLRKLG
jgi:HK97 gp10 family phage protein